MRSTLPELGAELALYSIDAVSDMIIWLDEDGYYVFVNKAATEFLGYTSQELGQLRVCDIDPDFDEVRWKDHWKELEIKRSVCLETTNRNKSGQIIPIEVNASLVQFEGKKFNCSIVRNISERKRTEASLLALNKQIYLLSITDDLTQLANRRHFDEVFKRELQRAMSRKS
ncbi:PAS domain-containing protein, partial [Herbaspirillum sp. B65]|uniref:PAS domain-containing protein n=1 Tax=Herbaspirillum sp. B65 TaxID=137708 RepID=UPI0005CB54D3